MTPPPADSLLIVLSGPSGVGKDAVIRALQAQRFPLHYAVTCTTRPPRPGEVDGRDYFFLTDEEFDRMIAADGLLEWAPVHGKRYGTPREQVREAIAAGKDVLLKVETQGAATIKRKVPETLLIFLEPPSMDDLSERLKRRATEDRADLALRTQEASEQLRESAKYDYVVINHEGRLDEAVEQIKRIIIEEKRRARPRCLEI